MKSVIVLGGYGNFGRRIAGALAADQAYKVYVAGRDLGRAREVAGRIGRFAEPILIDCHSAEFISRLRQVRADLVIHTAGPFQGKSYSVPQACAEAGCMGLLTVDEILHALPGLQLSWGTQAS